MDHIPFLVFVLWTACISDIGNVNHCAFLLFSI